MSPFTSRCSATRRKRNRRLKSGLGWKCRHRCGSTGLLAGELGISRSRLQALEEKRLLVVVPDGAKALRKPARDGTTVRIDLAGEADREAIISAASG